MLVFSLLEIGIFESQKQRLLNIRVMSKFSYLECSVLNFRHVHKLVVAFLFYASKFYARTHGKITRSL